jgi:hypothetical protein
MFEQLAEHSRIVVTGPQRAGTRIATKMIAADTGHTYVDESEFAFTNGAKWRKVLRRNRVVVQCPAMMKDVVDDPPPGIFVVLMRRSLDEIHESAERIDWEGEHQGNTAELQKFGQTEGDSASLKYEYWNGHTDRSFPFLEVNYESLKDHRLWIDKDLRKDFTAHQTTISD